MIIHQLYTQLLLFQHHTPKQKGKQKGKQRKKKEKRKKKATYVVFTSYVSCNKSHDYERGFSDMKHKLTGKATSLASD